MSNHINKMNKKLTKVYIDTYVGICKRLAGKPLAGDQVVKLQELGKRAGILVVEPIPLISKKDFRLRTYENCKLGDKVHYRDVFYQDAICHKNIVIGVKNAAKCKCTIPCQPPIQERKCTNCESKENLSAGMYAEQMECDADGLNPVHTHIYDWIYFCLSCKEQLMVQDEAANPSIIETERFTN